MLRHTSYTLETIAEATGYYSSSHLARHVKSVLNESPGAVRKAAQGNFAALATTRADSEPSAPGVLVV
jgi:transcriptional regulator GlxA family with amidase domain